MIRWTRGVGRASGFILAATIAACDSASTTPGGPSEWFVDSTASVTIGGAAERLDYIVYGVVGASRLSDGRIMVASQNASQLKFFGPDGKHERSVGRPGRGPGEYEAMFAAFRVRGDTTLVVSRAPGLTWVAPDGSYARSSTVNVMASPRHPCRIADLRMWAVANSRLLVTLDENVGMEGCPTAAPDGVWRGTTLVELQDPVEGEFETLGVLPGSSDIRRTTGVRRACPCGRRRRPRLSSRLEVGQRGCRGPRLRGPSHMAPAADRGPGPSCGRISGARTEVRGWRPRGRQTVRLSRDLPPHGKAPRDPDR